MVIQHPSTDALFASLRAATKAEPGRAWLPPALHALIIACLARLFDRLEDLLGLWRAGLLPPTPAPHTPSPTALVAPHAPARMSRQANSGYRNSVDRPAAVVAPQPASAPAATPRVTAGHAQLGTVPFGRTMPGLSRAPRVPPPALPLRFFTLLAAEQARAYNVPIS